MRTIALAALVLVSCFPSAFAASAYGERLKQYYGFEIVLYNNQNYVWAWRNPETGVRIFHQWSSSPCADPAILEASPVLVNYYADGRALFWVPVPHYGDYAGYTETGLLSSTPTIGSAREPMSDAYMTANNLRPDHPDEFTSPEYPDPGGEGTGGNSSGEGYDYRGRLDRIISYLSIIATALCIFMGLFVWRLAVLARNQRNL